MRSGRRRVWIYFNIHKGNAGERCLIDGFSERTYVVIRGRFLPVCLLLVTYFFDHDIIDTVNIGIKKRNSVFMQAQIVLQIIRNQFCSAAMQC